MIRMAPKTRRINEFCGFFMIGQSFVKSIGVFPGGRGTSLKKHAVLRELTARYNTQFLTLLQRHLVCKQSHLMVIGSSTNSFNIKPS